MLFLGENIDQNKTRNLLISTRIFADLFPPRLEQILKHKTAVKCTRDFHRPVVDPTIIPMLESKNFVWFRKLPISV